MTLLSISGVMSTRLYLPNVVVHTIHFLSHQSLPSDQNEDITIYLKARFII